MGKLKRTALGLFTSVLLLAFMPAVSFARMPAEKKVILILINATTLDELLAAPAPNIKRMIDTGAMSLMNARAGVNGSTGSYYLSIGAGARADAGAFGNLGFNATESMPVNFYKGRLTARDLARQDSRHSVSKQAIVNISINDAAAKNIKFHNNITPGLLGEALKRSGRRSAAVGNADTLNAAHREISLITMDLKGVTAQGDVSNDLALMDRSFPGGLRTDYKKLIAKISRTAATSDFIAVDLGDRSRVNSQRSWMTAPASAFAAKNTIADADEFIGRLQKKFPADRTLIILACPQPQTEALNERDYLTPIIVSGLGKGMLTSNTTRRPGLISNIDIAPTILDYFGLAVPIEMAGSRIQSRAADGVVSYLEQRHSRAVAMRAARSPFLVVYTLLVLAGAGMALGAIKLRALSKEVPAKYLSVLRVFLLVLLAVPLASLLQIPLELGNLLPALLSLLVIALALGLAGFALSMKDQLFAFIAIGAVTALTIAFDAFTGTVLSERSFFGSDLIAGGRFYGVGNTLLGIMIGAALLSIAAALCLGKFRDLKVPAAIGGLLMLAVTVIVSHPRLGANVGGIIIGLATTLFFFVVLIEGRFTFKTVAACFLTFAVLAALILSLDLPAQGEKSHAGKEITLIGAKGAPAIGDIINRKLTADIRSFMTLPGFLVLAMVLLVIALRWALTSRSIFGALRPRFGFLVKGFKTIIFAAVVAGLFKDTGAVAVAAVLIYLLIPLFLLALDPDNVKADEVRPV